MIMAQAMPQAENYDQLFQIYDTNHDGTISRQDFDLMAQRVLKAFNHSPTSPVGQRLGRRYTEAWEMVADADADRDGKITKDQFRNAMAAYAAKEHLFEDVSRGITAAEFDAADLDEDGVLDRTEFATLVQAFGYESPDVDSAFAHIDQDNDGRITREEYYQAWRQHTSQPSQAGNGSIFGQKR
jgi:Ca2+-binding EF-hand superfamily protein